MDIGNNSMIDEESIAQCVCFFVLFFSQDNLLGVKDTILVYLNCNPLHFSYFI